MKRLLFLLVCLVTCVIGDAQRIFNLKTLQETKDTKETIPTRDVVETSEGIVVTYNFNNIGLQEDPIYKGSTLVNIDGFWPNCNDGEPSILSRMDTFIVPDKSSRVVVTDSTYVEIPMELSPARPVLSNEGYESYTRSTVKPVTRFSGFFPTCLIPEVNSSEYRGQPLLYVRINPVQYDYTNKIVRVFTKIQYKVLFDGTRAWNLQTDAAKSINSVGGDSYLNNIAVNGTSYTEKVSAAKGERATMATSLNPSHYLIVTVPTFATAVNRLAEWKRTLGFDVHVAIQNSWDTLAVKNVITNSFHPYSTDYLLIVGRHSVVPGFIRDKVYNNENHIHPTDLYYASNNNSYLPSFYRGRIPVGSLSEAEVVIDKIVNYEKMPVSDTIFYKTGIHCAFFQDTTIVDSLGNTISVKDEYEDRCFSQTSERIRNRMTNLFKTVHRVYFANGLVNPRYWNNTVFSYGEQIPNDLRKPSFPWNGSASDITSLINQKAFYVFQRDHGAITQWGRPSYSTINIGDLTNGNYLPVVFSISCQTGKYDVANSFCEKFLKKENGGCVAIYGATQKSLSGPNDVLAGGMFDAIWPSSSLLPIFPYFNISYSSTPSPTYRLGQILDQGLFRVQEAYGTPNQYPYKTWYARYTSELFHCFGDPSMMIYTVTPTAFSGASIVRQNGTITVNTGGTTATIAYYNRRTGVVEAFSGTSHTHADDPEISVSISAHNKIPYIDAGTLFIQNKTLTSSAYYEAKTIKVGNNVTTTQTQGDVNFTQGSHHLIGDQIELHPGTTISVGTTVEIKNN
jgi:hypothetical protein